MNRPLAWRLVRTALSTAVALLMTDRPARAETFPASPFNGMQITYSLSGATVDTQEDGEGFTVSRRLSGKLGDGTLRVSGTAGMGNGYSADLVVTVSVGGKQGEFKLNIPSGYPGMNTKPFDVAVPIPDDATHGSVSVSMAGHYNAGGRGLVVSGEFGREAKPKGGSSGLFSGWLPGGDGKKPTPKPSRELPVRGTLAVTQELSPPRRIVSFDIRRPIESLAGQGTAIHRLVLEVGGLPADAAAAVVAGFEIDPPSRITGPARRVRLDGGRAVTTFVFQPSEAEGQGGVVFARARFPVSVKEEEDGSWTASERTQLAVAKVRPICDRGASMYYNDQLVSDATYDLPDLERELGSAVARYGKERISATPYTSAGLGWFLAHPGGKAMGISIEYYTGQEVQLHRAVVAEGRKKRLTPGELFAKALELNAGDMTKALLTCHNVLRAASGRGGEAFPRTGLTEEEKALLVRKGLSAEEMAKRQEVMLSTGEFSDSRIWDSLVPLRPGVDNKGAWYHLMGTATMSLAVQSNFLADNAVQMPSGQRAGLEGVIWAEEYLQSGDIYSDPNEYCIDAQGLLLGDFLRSQLTGARRETLKAQLSDRLKRLRQAGSGGRDRRVAVEVRCPVSTTLTDPASGRYFKLDQTTGEVEGDLALGFGLEPEGEFFGLVAVVPRSDLALRVDPVAAGRFSIRTWDPARGKATAFEDVAARRGEVWTLDTSAGEAEPTLRETSGAVRSGTPRAVEAAAVARVYAAASNEAISRGGFSADPRTGALRDLSATPARSARPERAARGPNRRWAVALALVAFVGFGATFGLAVLVALARRGSVPGRDLPAPVRGLEVDGSDGPALVPLGPGGLTIGRREGNGLVLADPEVSGTHVEIDVLHGQVVLRDLGSRNGTRLNGQPVRSAVLGPGDRIGIGATVIVVR